MFELIGGIVGGLGLFTVGMSFLTRNLKTLASRRLRQVAQKWTENPFKAILWGTTVGTITQSMSAFTFLVVSLLRSGLITTKGALALILGGGIGVTLLVFILTFDIKIMCLYILGISGAVLVSGKLSKYRAIAGSFFGAAMIILGLALLKDAAAPLADQPWFGDLMERSGESLLLSFLIAAVLTAIVQSSSAVSVFGISLATIGLISVDQTIMIMYGSFIGSSTILYILSANLKGKSRQVAMYMVVYNLIICAVLVPLLYVEIHFDIPLVKALVLSFNADLAQQMAFVYFFSGVVLLPLMLLGINFSVLILERVWPSSRFDELSRTQFIHDHAVVDADISLELIELEQKRTIKMLPQYFDMVRTKQAVEPLRGALGQLILEIDDCMTELQTSHPRQCIEFRNEVMNRQRLLVWLEDNVGTLCENLTQLSDRPSLNRFRSNICEGVDGVLLSLNDALDAEDRISWDIMHRLVGDRRELMRKIRIDYMDADSSLDNMELANILLITNLVEDTFFVLSKISVEYDSFSIEREHIPHRQIFTS